MIKEALNRFARKIRQLYKDLKLFKRKPDVEKKTNHLKNI